MTLPNLPVLLSSGESIEFDSLLAKGPLAMIFLRHLGCTFCKEQVAWLRDESDLNLAFVTMAGPTEAEAFRRKMKMTHPLICDPELALYHAIELRRAKTSEIFSLRVIARGTMATLKGHLAQKPVGDPWQMPGACIVDKGREVVWVHRSKDAADNLSASEIRQALAEAQKQTA